MIFLMELIELLKVEIKNTTQGCIFFIDCAFQSNAL